MERENGQETDMGEDKGVDGKEEGGEKDVASRTRAQLLAEMDGVRRGRLKKDVFLSWRL